MKTTPFSLDQLVGSGTISVDLPADVAGMLRREARANRKPVADMVREWLEDRAEARAAEKALQSALKINKGKQA